MKMKNQGFAGMFLKESIKRVGPKVANKDAGLPDRTKDLEDATIEIAGVTQLSAVKLHSINSKGSEAKFSKDGKDYTAIKCSNGKWYLNGDYENR